uniref:Uncharacterized protein n=1 Tax=Candidatus Kentrum sp. DK TaxID=2126562 RepID=A0A450RZ15_9GAMM|nr:MAG: hypothetical protein BECKDK2373C_GA0170839_100850 [Candidatus Kentron sp. DK]
MIPLAETPGRREEERRPLPMEGADVPLPWRVEPAPPDRAAGVPVSRTTEAPNRWQEEDHAIPWGPGKPERPSPGDYGDPPTIPHDGEPAPKGEIVSLAKPDSEPSHASRKQAATRENPPPAKAVADNQLRELLLFGVVPVVFLCLAAAGYLFWRVTTAEFPVADPMPPPREETAGLGACRT